MAGPATATAPELETTRSRPAPVDADPSHQLDAVLDLLDDLALVTTGSAALFRGIERVTGLRVGEIQVLRAIAHGADQTQQIASRVGQPDEAAMATVGGLVERELLQWHSPGTSAGSDSVGGLRLTDVGTAVLEQSEGVQIRLLDTLVGELGQQGVGTLRTSLGALARVFGAMRSKIGRTEATG